MSSLADKLGRMCSVVFANYEGLPVKDIEALRRELKVAGIDYTVAKKTLLGLAAKAAHLDLNPKEVEGNFAVVISYEDEVAAAKILAKFAKDHEALRVVGGVLQGKMISSAMTLALAKVPSKKELLGLLVGSLNSPIFGFVNVLAGNLRGLLTVMNAIKDKKTA